jgi:hypothetical protein
MVLAAARQEDEMIDAGVLGRLGEGSRFSTAPGKARSGK